MMKKKYLVVTGLLALPLAGCGPVDSTVDPCAAAYPRAPTDASEVAYVSSCGAADGDGTREKPFASIQQGIDAVGEGGAVLVQMGRYAENLVIEKPVQVLGGEPEAAGEDAGIIVQAPAPRAVVVREAAGVTLRGLRVEKPIGAGIWVQKGTATLAGVKIEGAVASAEGIEGHGLVAVDNASIIVQRTIIVQSQRAGVFVDGSKAQIEGSVIKDSGEIAGIWVQRSANTNIQGELTVGGDSEIVHNAEAGIAVRGSRAIIVQSQVRDTIAGHGKMADGIRVEDTSDPALGLEPAYVEIKTSTISGNDRAGILFSGNTRGIIVQNTVRGNGDDFSRGAGIWVQRGAGGLAEAIKIEGNTITENRFLGIGVTTNARAIIVQNTAISGTIAAEGAEHPQGDGIGVFSGGHAELQGNKVFDNARAGAIFDDASLACSLVGNAFERNEMSIVVQHQVSSYALDQNTWDTEPLEVLDGQVNDPMLPPATLKNIDVDGSEL